MFYFIRKQQFRKRDFGLLIVAVLLLVISLAIWWKNPFLHSDQFEVMSPYFTVMDDKGNSYIINNGKSEVVRINKEGKVDAQIIYTTHEMDCFSEADEVAVDKEGNIYILDIVWNDTGLGLSNERILKYDSKGRFKEVVFDNDYSEYMIMKRHCFSLRRIGDNIVFATVSTDGKSIDVHEINTGNGSENVVVSVPYEEAEFIQDITVSDFNQIYFVDKQGKIHLNDTRNDKVIFEQNKEEYMLPYFLSSNEEGTLYFTDICNQEIYTVSDGDIHKLFDVKNLSVLTGMDLSSSVLETIHIENNPDGDFLCLTCVDGSAVINLSTKECVSYTTIPYTEKYQVMYWYQMIVKVLVGIIVAYYLLALFIYLMKRKVLAKKKMIIVLIAGVAFTAIFVMSSMLKNLQNNYTNNMISNMCTVTQIASSIIEPEVLEAVNYPSDYGNENYQKLQEYMRKLVDVTSPYSENIYCNIVKYKENRCYALAYLDNSIGAYYPLDQREVSEAREVYDSGELYINDGKSDATGSYVYVKSPIKDTAGKVIGIVEIGMVSDTLSGMLDEIKTDMVVEVLLVLIIAIFFINECTAFLEEHKEWKQLSRKRNSVQFAIPYLRLITFLCFAAYNMPTSFLPVYVEKFYTDSLPFPIEVAGSLPLTINFAMIGFMSLFCTGFLRKIGFRATMMIGAFMCTAGDLSMALANVYWIVMIGLLLNGIGCGMLMNGLSIIVANQDDENQTKGFSVINGSILSGMICGTVIGAGIARKYGSARMFLVSGGIWLVIACILFRFGKSFRMHHDDGTNLMKQEKARVKDLFSRPILGFLILIVIPYTVINGFTSYFLPIFADANGLNEVQTSLLLVMNCLVGIFLSKALTDACTKAFGRAAMYISSILSLGAVVLFAYFQNIYMLAFVLFILGFAKSFGAPTREVEFCNQPFVKKIGEDKAMGYYNLADNLGESLGTVVFGGIMSFGLLSGLWLLSGISVLMLGLFEVGNYKKQK